MRPSAACWPPPDPGRHCHLCHLERIIRDRITQKSKNPPDGGFFDAVGGAKRDRTADLYNAIVALSQLSYSPVTCDLTIIDLVNQPYAPGGAR